MSLSEHCKVQARATDRVPLYKSAKMLRAKKGCRGQQWRRRYSADRRKVKSCPRIDERQMETLYANERCFAMQLVLLRAMTQPAASNCRYEKSDVKKKIRLTF